LGKKVMTNSKNMETDHLIAELAANASPVRPLRAPMLRAAGFLAIGTAFVALVVAVNGLRHDLDAVMALPWRRTEFAASIATAVLAVIAAFHLAVPGRSAAWALLPVPAATTWLATLGFGCWADFVRLGPEGLAWGTSWSCLKSIVLTSIPLGGLLFWMIRFGDAARPLPAAAYGVLAVAAMGAAGLSLYHHLEAAFLVLLWHVGTVALLVATAAMGNRGIFRAINR
jgi:hypothetical protein